MGSVANSELTRALQNFIANQGSDGCVEGSVEPIPEGHAGLAYSFSLVRTDGVRASYVLKLAPAGIKRSGSTDIYRQYPLLRLLKRRELPVPGIPWASESEEWLGAPFVVMERLPGKSLIIWEADSDDLEGYWKEAVRMLARFHSGISVTDLMHWEQPGTLEQEIARWRRLIKHSSDESDRLAAERLAEALSLIKPNNPAMGLVHGDYQPGNILYVDKCATALIDWDLAAVGAVMIDLGWLLMMADRSAWAEEWQPRGAPQASVLISIYEAAGGEVSDDLAWYQALACYRMGVITGMNVKLHREGRRHDPIWEKFAPSAKTLLGRGMALIEEEARRTQ
jgi:aminoglycoside phosphotransferase (APT) family kinase protein